MTDGLSRKTQRPDTVIGPAATIQVVATVVSSRTESPVCLDLMVLEYMPMFEYHSTAQVVVLERYKHYKYIYKIYFFPFSLLSVQGSINWYRTRTS
jgi:hypothetical protein